MPMPITTVAGASYESVGRNRPGLVSGQHTALFERFVNSFRIIRLEELQLYSSKFLDVTRYFATHDGLFYTYPRRFVIIMSSINTNLNPREVLTSIIKNASTISAISTIALGQNSITDQGSSFGDLVAKLDENQQSRVKNVLLTLHFLFPHELLPSLDLLDRNLITCLRLARSESESLASSTALSVEQNEELKAEASSKFYYVQSASATAHTSSTSGLSNSTSRFRNVYSTVGTYYEVHLDSWNCSCPAFAFSSLKLLMSTTDVHSDSLSTKQGQSGEKNDYPKLYSEHLDSANKEEFDSSHVIHARNKGQNWRFGGSAVTTDSIVPICKHILAVVLANGMPDLFGDAVRSAEVTKEEVAGRAAGFGTK